MEISVIGAGYVGLVTGACFAGQGHTVTCADVDAEKIVSLQRSFVPLYEPGLEPLVRQGLREGRLIFTTEIADAVQRSSLISVAVGTPATDNGLADTRALLDVAESIATSMREPKAVVLKSTVPVGTAQKIHDAMNRDGSFPTALLSNPEFLREGHSVEDSSTCSPRCHRGRRRCCHSRPVVSTLLGVRPGRSHTDSGYS